MPSMDDALPQRWHLFWGLGLCLSATIVGSQLSAMFHSLAIFPASQLFGLVAVTDAILTLPLIFFAVKRWNATTRADYIGLTVLSMIVAFGFVPVIYCLQSMTIGDFSAIENCSVVWAPLLESAYRRRCVRWFHLGAAVLALVGVVLVSRPSFIFGQEKNARSRSWSPYLVCFGLSLLQACFFLVFEICHHLHWFVWRVAFVPSSVLSFVVFNAVAGSWSLPVTADWFDYLGGFVCGVLVFVERICLTTSSDEFERHAQGISATMSLTIITLKVPLSYALAYFYFRDSFTALQAVGGALIVVVVLCIAAFTKEERKRAEEELEEEEINLKNGEEVTAFDSS